MVIAERLLRAFSSKSAVSALLVPVLLSGCTSILPDSPGPEYSYRDPAIPEMEHQAILRALNDLAGTDTHGRLKAALYFDEMGPALGVRLVPYWVQLLDHPSGEVRLSVANLIIKFCGRSSTPLLLDFMEWSNEAVRRDAYQKLRLLTGTEFGYRYDASEEERQRKIEEIRERLGIPSETAGRG